MPHEAPLEEELIGEAPYERILHEGAIVVHDRFVKGKVKREREGGSRVQLPKALIIVAGHEGSGKSRATRALEENAEVVVIDKDKINNKFYKTRAEHNDPLHTLMRPRIYRAMYELGDMHLRDGKSVILDAPFNKFEDFFHNEAWFEKIADIAERNNAEPVVIWCYATPEIKEARLKKRNAPQDAGRDLRRLASRTDIPRIPFKNVLFDTEGPDDTKFSQLAGFLHASAIERVAVPEERLPAS